MPKLSDGSANASNISDKLIEIREGKDGNMLRVVNENVEEVVVVWVKDKEGKPRRFRATDEIMDFCNKAGVDVQRTVEYYMAAISGQSIKVKSKKTAGKIIHIVQLESECGIFKFGVKLFRKLKSIYEDTQYDGGITARNLKIKKLSNEPK